jgi:DNA-directed RNA polymerase subunit E'/Rpb7
MDPLFERRELRRNIHVESRFLQRNIDASLLAQLRMNYEGVCLPEGFVQPGSIVIAEHSLGRTNLIRGGLDYVVKFQADVCLPHPGQVLRVPVTLKSKIGVYADKGPIRVLLPRDLHLGIAQFEDLAEGQDIEFEVVGTRFQQGDDRIVVLGKLREIIKAAVEEQGAPESTAEPMIAAPVFTKGDDSGEKRVVTVDMSSTKPVADVTRRARIKIKPAATQNE